MGRGRSAALVADRPRAEVQLVETASPKRSFEISSHKGKTFESTQEEIRGNAVGRPTTRALSGSLAELS